MRPKTNIILASVLIVTLGTVNSKSIGDAHAAKNKRTFLGGSENDEGILNKLIHKKSLIDSTPNGINPDWIGDMSLTGVLGLNENESRGPIIDNMVLDDNDNKEAKKRLEVLALIEAAMKQDLPWDYYLSMMSKRSGGEDLMLGYEDIMNQPRLLDRETRDDGRRYLMWRKITG